MDWSKVHLSEQEIDLVKDPAIILMKNSIISKVYECYGILSEEMKSIVAKRQDKLPAETIVHSPRISRGENYKFMPYVMLDYPRIFSLEQIFAIRTFFWWGRCFNITLHLRGRYQTEFRNALELQFPALQSSGFYISNTKDEWDHDITGDGYISLQQLSAEEFQTKLSSDSFIKIGASYPIEEWNKATNIITATYQLLIDILTQLPSR